MKVLFIGLGSIAKRHINNLKELYPDIVIHVLRTINHNTDNYNLLDKVLYSSDELDPKYDAIFITNPTSLHYKTLSEHIERSDNFFIEKPVFETGNNDLSFLNNYKNKKFYVACPLRYSNVIQYLKNNIDFSNVYSIRCISSSYLPDWRKDTDYRTTYSASKELGGGVEIDLIHEWDYITYLIGMPNIVKSIITKKSDLEINSNDIAVYIAEYNDKVVELHLDYFGRKEIRKIELFTKEDTIVADLIEQKVSFLKHQKEIDLSEDRNDYQKKELEFFFDIVNGKEHSTNDITKACELLRLARGE